MQMRDLKNKKPLAARVDEGNHAAGTRDSRGSQCPLRQPIGTSFNSWRPRPMTPGREPSWGFIFFVAMIEVGQAYFRLLYGNVPELPSSSPSQSRSPSSSNLTVCVMRKTVSTEQTWSRGCVCCSYLSRRWIITCFLVKEEDRGSVTGKDL